MARRIAMSAIMTMAAALRCTQQQFGRQHPLRLSLLRLGQAGDVAPRVAQRHQLPAIGQDDRIVEGAIPAQCRQPFLSTATLKPGGIRGGSVSLQSGHSASAPPQVQARSPSHGRSGWFPQIQRQSSQRWQATRHFHLGPERLAVG
jgi:hypothetical protein